MLGIFVSAGGAPAARTDNSAAPEATSEAQATFTRHGDLIYSKQGGFALTLDRIAPAQANGAGVLMVVSGGWLSGHEGIETPAGQLPEIFQANAAALLARGYTLFYVVHGSQPKFTIREIDTQLAAAVRHVRYHAADYGIDPGRIGIMGGSAGGHLSLLRGTKGADGATAAPATPAETGSRVQAVVAYFPPTDFLNYGADGVFFDTVVRQVLPEGRNPFLQATDYWEFDPVEVRLNKVTDAKRLAEHYRQIGPSNHVSADDAPTLLLHGDLDRLVPLQQSELIAERFAQAGVKHRLYVKDGGDHGWNISAAEAAMVADWFDQHL